MFHSIRRVDIYRIAPSGIGWRHQWHGSTSRNLKSRSRRCSRNDPCTATGPLLVQALDREPPSQTRREGRCSTALGRAVWVARRRSTTDVLSSPSSPHRFGFAPWFASAPIPSRTNRKRESSNDIGHIQPLCFCASLFCPPAHLARAYRSYTH